jgi:hypothetical protein
VLDFRQLSELLLDGFIFDHVQCMFERME